MARKRTPHPNRKVPFHPRMIVQHMIGHELRAQGGKIMGTIVAVGSTMETAAITVKRPDGTEDIIQLYGK